MNRSHHFLAEAFPLIRESVCEEVFLADKLFMADTVFLADPDSTLVDV